MSVHIAKHIYLNDTIYSTMQRQSVMFFPKGLTYDISVTVPHKELDGQQLQQAPWDLGSSLVSVYLPKLNL